MLKVVQYFGRFQQFRGGLSAFPGWARLILLIFALPGLLLVALSIVLFVVSILALLLLVGPVYRLLSAVFVPRVATQPGTVWVEEVDADQLQGQSESTISGRRHIDVKIVE